MKPVWLTTALLLCGASAAAAEDARLAASRDLANHLQADLGARLQSALGDGGPVGAMGVCQLEAPTIAAAVAAGSGAKVGRTALRIRNPANAPDDEARQVLEEFELRHDQGASQAPLEYFATREDGSARYLRAIIAQPPCLACHGTRLATEVEDAITALYPGDEATGFAAGDVRGAFVVDWPATE